MRNPVCVIFYREDSSENWELYGLTESATIAAKMLIENGMITKGYGVNTLILLRIQH